MKLTLEIDYESDLLEEIEVDGITYYKLKDDIDVDKVIVDKIKSAICSHYYWHTDIDVKEIIKQCCKECKEEIIERTSMKIKNSIIHSKQIQELKKEVL